MTDHYGALEVPVPVPLRGSTVADPLLDLLGAYLQAAANFDTKAAWCAVHPIAIKPWPEPVPIVAFFTHDPREADFESQKLPSLFLYRTTAAKTERVGQDITVTPSRIALMWVPPHGTQDQLALRQPFRNALEATFRAALRRLRHKAWAVPNDPDPKTADYGSFFMKYAKLYTEPEVMSSRHDLLRLPHYDDPRQSNDYDIVMFEIEVREALTPNMDDYDLGDHVETTLSANGLPLGSIAFKPSLTSCTPSSGPVGTSITILGNQFVDDMAFSMAGAWCTDVTRIDDCTFTAKVGTHPAGGPFDLLATAPSGESASLPNAFTYV